jgi:hypothetical protein
VRKSGVYLMTALCIVALSVNGTADDKTAWFGKENCEFCEVWSADPELKKNIVWEMQETADGVLSVISVEASHALAFHKANSAYDKVLEKLVHKEKSGEETPLCGSCSTLLSFFPRGVKMNNMNAGTSHIMLLTSGSKRLVADLHKWVQRNEEELAQEHLAQNNK